MQNYYSIELVKNTIYQGESRWSYHLLTKVFGNYHKAVQEFKHFIRMYPGQRLELDSAHNVTTEGGYMPLAWIN